MQPGTSRDIPDSEPRKDAARDSEKATIKDGDKTGQADWDRIHGDGKDLGLDQKK